MERITAQCRRGPQRSATPRKLHATPYSATHAALLSSLWAIQPKYRASNITSLACPPARIEFDFDSGVHMRKIAVPQSPSSKKGTKKTDCRETIRIGCPQDLPERVPVPRISGSASPLPRVACHFSLADENLLNTCLKSSIFSAVGKAPFWLIHLPFSSGSVSASQGIGL